MKSTMNIKKILLNIVSKVFQWIPLKGSKSRSKPANRVIILFFLNMQNKIHKHLRSLQSIYEKYSALLLWDKDYRELLHWVGVSALFTLWGMGLWYAVTILQARWFGADGVWLMAMINTIVVFAGAVAWLGMQWSVVRYINQWKAQWVAGRIRTLHGYIVKTVLPFSIMIAVLLFLTKERLALEVFGDERLIIAIQWLALAFPCIVLGNIGLEILKGYKDLITYHSINKIWRVLIKLAVLAGVRYWSGSVYGPVVAMLASGSIWLLFALPWLWKWWKSLPSKEEISRSDILKTSLPMMVTSISLVIMNQTDIVMLGMYSDTAEVGVYQVAFRLARLVPFGLMLVNMIIGQKIAQLYYAGEKEKLQNILRLWSSISTIFGIGACLIFIPFAGFWMNMFGNEFVGGAILLQILCVGQLVNAGAGSVGIYLNMTNRERTLQNIVLVTALLNIILNFLFITHLWAIWCALASTISLIWWNWIITWQIRKKDWINMLAT